MVLGITLKECSNIDLNIHGTVFRAFMENGGGILVLSAIKNSHAIAMNNNATTIQRFKRQANIYVEEMC